MTPATAPSIPAHLTSRIPNLLHFLLFLAITFFAFLLSETVILLLAHHHPLMENLVNQKLQLLANILAYLVALAASWFIFPLLWHRSFIVGISWNSPAARPWLILVGLVAGFVAQGVTTLLPAPKNLPIEEFFHNPATIWILVLFGTFLAPLFEETLFRGFLLPGIAIAVDWLRLPRSSQVNAEDALGPLEAWRASGSYSVRALVISSIITSLLFALIHAPQLGYTLPALALLAAVSLILCYIRIRTRSVAAGTLIHGSYNLSVFLTLFVSTGGFRHLDKL